MEQELFTEKISSSWIKGMMILASISGIVCTALLIVSTKNEQKHATEEFNRIEVRKEASAFEEPSERVSVKSDSIQESKMPIQEESHSGVSNYYLIANTFLEKRNAERYLIQIQARIPDAEILEGTLGKRNCYRVSVLHTNSSEEAKAGRKSLIQNYGTEVWIFSK